MVDALQDVTDRAPSLSTIDDEGVVDVPLGPRLPINKLSHDLELADQLLKVVPVYLNHVPVDSSVLVTSSSGFFRLAKRLAKFRNSLGSRRS